MPSRPQAPPATGSGALRLMPSVDECLNALESEPALSEVKRARLVEAVRAAQTAIRAQASAGQLEGGFTRAAILARIVDDARRRLLDHPVAWQPVINATGVVIHTNLGRALLAEVAAEAVARAAREPIDLEFDLASGSRGDRDRLVEEELCALCGAPAATVVNNNAAAVLLALDTLARGREVIVSRGELIEIGGSFRIPDVMEKSGARLREVGTTNRTHLKDYAQAIGPETALLLKVHPSNYRVVGFTAAVELRELCELGRREGIAVMEDLGSGALLDLRPLGLKYEPVVQERIAAGADLVCFSGDKLLGGPQAGILVGRSDLIQRLKANPLKRALRCDKLTLVALAATLRLYRWAAQPARELPTLRFLARTVEELESCAQQASTILHQRLDNEFTITVAASTSEVGSGSMPGEELPTRVLRITHPRHSSQRIAAWFRGARPPIIGRIQEGAFQLDLRTIEDPEVLAVTLPPL
jgi:L-seryl-tRNA(Ser) seleniumtransferase